MIIIPINFELIRYHRLKKRKPAKCYQRLAGSSEDKNILRTSVLVLYIIFLYLSIRKMAKFNFWIKEPYFWLLYSLFLFSNNCKDMHCAGHSLGAYNHWLTRSNFCGSVSMSVAA